MKNIQVKGKQLHGAVLTNPPGVSKGNLKDIAS